MIAQLIDGALQPIDTLPTAHPSDGQQYNIAALHACGHNIEQFGFYQPEKAAPPENYNPDLEKITGYAPPVMENGAAKQYPIIEPRTIADIARAERTKRQVEGFEYAGKIIQLHEKEAIIVMQVKAAFELGALSTIIEFPNGETLPLTASEFPAFAAAFAAARNAIFGGT